MENEKLKIDQLINYLTNEKNLHEPLIQRKETASWSFIIFYVASIWAIYNSFLENETLHSAPLMISLITVGILLGWIAFQFVHSQYASIYWRIAYTRAIDRTINDLTKKDSTEKELDFSWDKEKSTPEFLSEQILPNLKKIQPFWGKIHPLQILLRFWFYLLYRLYWFIAKKLNREKEMVKLGNPAKQEACLYSIIILVTIVYSYLVWQLFCNIPPK